jgi:hypothetical protein
MAEDCGLNGGEISSKVFVKVAIFLKCRCCMAAMAIEDEETVTCSSFGLRTAVKYLLRPGQSDFVI